MADEPLGEAVVVPEGAITTDQPERTLVRRWDYPDNLASEGRADRLALVFGSRGDFPCSECRRQFGEMWRPSDDLLPEVAVRDELLPLEVLIHRGLPGERAEVLSVLVCSRKAGVLGPTGPCW